jgi:hypothetical protein
MDDKETTRKTPEAIVVSTHPDVCKSPVAPVPYQIVGIFKDSSALTSSVLATIQNVFVATSQIDRVTGDEGGTGKGIKSGTHADSGVCKPTGWSSTVRAEKQFVVRNGDSFSMNAGNTDGSAVYPDGAGPAGGVDEEGKPTQDPNPNIEREKKGFFEGIGKSGGDAAEDIKGLYNAAYDSGPAGDAARAALGESAKSTALMGMDGFLFLHGAPMDRVGAFNRIGEKGVDIVSAVKDRYVEAYEVGGFRYAMGVVTGDVVIGAAGTKGTTVGLRAAMRGVGNGVRVVRRRPRVLRRMSREDVKAWLEQNGVPKEKINSYMDGIDFSKPVETVELPAGTQLSRYGYPSSFNGQFATNPGTPMNILGMAPTGRVLGTTTLGSPMSVLRSTAGEWNSFPGGGIQYQFGPGWQDLQWNF